MTNELKQDIISGTLIFVLVLSVYLFKFRYAGAGDTVPNELLPVAIIREHKLDFNEFVKNPEKLKYFFVNVDGKVVSFYSLVTGFMNTPVYAAASLFGIDIFSERFILSMISASGMTALSVVFMYLCLLRVTEKKATAVFFALVYAFGTTAWSITSRGVWHHTSSLLFMTIALYILLSKNETYLPFAGLFLGLMILSREGNAAMVVSLLAYVLIYFKKRFKYFLILFLIPPAFLLFNYRIWTTDLVYLSGNMIQGAAGLLFSPSRGLFVFSPIFIFAFMGIAYILFKRNENQIFPFLAAAVALHIIFFSRFQLWWGGHCFGYRYFTEIVPMLVIFLSVYWEKVMSTRAYMRVLFLLFFAFSVYFHFLGAFYYPSGFNWYPDDINNDTKRLWNFRDTELTRCTIGFLINSGIVKRPQG